MKRVFPGLQQLRVAALVCLFAYKFGKMKFPEFSGPSKRLFPENYEEKTRRNELT